MSKFNVTAIGHCQGSFDSADDGHFKLMTSGAPDRGLLPDATGADNTASS